MKASVQEQSVAARVAALADLPMNELWALWDRYFPRRPSHHNRHYVEARLAYKLQEEAFGALKPEAREQLLRIGEAHSRIQRRARREIHIVPGTVLVREYGEREHRVTALPDGGFDYEGRRFRSLSAVARFITGQHWSGPLFFGLVKQKRERR
ncbi:DUF2924 domain-containing protein [Pelomicrobium methylotrophicum]|uniref:DUF2924 domain-containing protein n=1 Tax=Pelomicrobium methylotrophicum TaxID=2602750 RepID=A0A5C7EWX8_9PROT|nr:DUF2924 domain-containing protein [Pelomicrobium methylotrophicum]TXF11555.1 DUF2924 domain-containing protein [Pelomicrobium methylotrophicum]